MLLDQSPRFGDPAPPQIVDHLAGDAEEKALIGVAEEVQSDPPAFLDLGQGLALLAHLLIHLPQPLMENEMAQTLGDRLDQFDLALEKGAGVSLGCGLSVGNKNPA
jgi:hypothetical protein